MPSISNRRRAAPRREFRFTLEGDAALAFAKAAEAAEIVGVGAKLRPNWFAAWLLGRAAEAYATARKHDRECFWKFDLQPRTFEESVAFDICYSLAENPEQFPLLKRKRAPHQQIGGNGGDL